MDSIGPIPNDDGENQIPVDGEGISEANLKAIKRKKGGKWRSTTGNWRSSYTHPVHIPEEFRQPIPEEIMEEWFGEEWKQYPPHSDEDREEIRKAFRVFRCLLREDHPGATEWSSRMKEWSSRMYKRFEEKLAENPRDCGMFGENWDASARFSIGSIYLIFNETKCETYCGNAVKHESEDFLAFHGTQLSSLRGILKDGFRMTKGGWFGNGAYFTNSMTYAQHYVSNQLEIADGEFAPQKERAERRDEFTGIHLPEVGHSVYVLACLLRPGDVKVVPADATPPGQGYQGPYRNTEKDPAFDSHVAYVTPDAGGHAFRPMREDQIEKNPEMLRLKEYVIFEQARILPRFIVEVRRDA